MTDRLNLPPGSRLLFDLACLVLVVLGLRAAALTRAFHSCSRSAATAARH